MGDPIQDQRAWLEAAVAASGLSATALAKKAGVAQTTVTRLLYNREPVHALNAHSLTAIEKASGLPFAQRPARPAGFAESEATPFRPDQTDSQTADLIASLVGRQNAVDPWVLQSRALESAGFAPGDIMLVDLNGEAASGDVVCAQVYDWTRGRAETIFRLFEPPFLVAQTLDAPLRKPMLVDNEKVALKGVVIATVRPRTRRAA